MKKLLFALAVVLGINASASHLLGGMIGVFQTSQDSTTIGMALVMDSQSPIPPPNSLYIEKWEMNSVGWYVQNGVIELTLATTSTHQGQPLINYTSQYLDLDSNKYRFIYQNCCWGMISNSTNSFNSNFIISTDYWHIPYNSTPYARVPFIINQQVGIRNTMKSMWGLNTFLVSPDWGDVVELTQTDLHSGYANGTFVPQIHTQLPLHVDNDSISWIPSTLGRYATGFEIADYRNGQKIGTQRIQWTFLVVNSTLSIEESELPVSYKVYDWYGRYVGNDLDGLKGLFVIRYSNGKSEKVFVN